MADSLVLAGMIELLGGGVESSHPQCAGAMFLLTPGYDLSAPQPTVDLVMALSLDGERPVGQRSSNRTLTIPVKITAPDRDTLAAAREVLLQAVDAPSWTLTWTREGGEPMILDCYRAEPSTIEYALELEQQFIARVEIACQALPYGRSDELETISFPAASSQWAPPPDPVLVDDYGSINSVANFLTGDNAGFDATAGTWTGMSSTAVARTTAQYHTGPGALRLTLSSASDALAGHCASANILTQGLACKEGDKIFARSWLRAVATAGRSIYSGAAFYNSGGTQIGSESYGGSGTGAVAWVQTPLAQLTAPAGAARCRIVARVQGCAASEQHDLDDVFLANIASGVSSSTQSSSWSWSPQHAAGSGSARWSRISGDRPLYTRTLPAPVSIDGLTRLTWWVGLTASNYSAWRKGRVTFRATLTDATGHTVSAGRQVRCHAGEGSPRWNRVTLILPPSATFDWTQVTAYTFEAWNHIAWDGDRVLQADLYLCMMRANPRATGSLSERGACYSLNGVRGSARTPLNLQILPGPLSVPTILERTTAGTTNWPATYTGTVKAECWAPGGGSGGGDSGAGVHYGGNGGSGGEYARDDNLACTNGQNVILTLGSPGSAGAQNSNGGDAGAATITGTVKTVTAHGGKGGRAGSTTETVGRPGGTGSTDPVHYDGGRGGPPTHEYFEGDSGAGSGGGSSAGTGAAGNQGGAVRSGGLGGLGGTAKTGGGPGGNGANWGAGAGHTPTSAPGGGAGGGDEVSGGAAGANGKVRITYTASVGSPMPALVVHSPGPDAPDALVPIVAVGDGADVPNGGTEYAVPNADDNVYSRFDGTYSVVLVASAWNSGGSSRTVTVTVKQYAYSGGPSATVSVQRTLTPNNDVTNGICSVGEVTLPVMDMAGDQTASYFVVTVNDSNTADRFLDVLLLDTLGQTVIVDSPTSYDSIWIDEPDPDRDLSRVLGGSDRSQAVSIMGVGATGNPYVRMSGGPLAADPGDTYLIVYQPSASITAPPSLQATYFPRWFIDRMPAEVA